MTRIRANQKELTTEEWDEMLAIKNAIDYDIRQVHPDKMELFTAFLVQTLEGKGDSHA